MINLQLAKQIFTWSAVLSGLVSAYFWYRASVAKVTSQQNRHDPDTELTMRDKTDPNKTIYVVASAMEQSRLSKFGAIFTALAVLCQAIATAIPEA